MVTVTEKLNNSGRAWPRRRDTTSKIELVRTTRPQQAMESGTGDAHGLWTVDLETLRLLSRSDL